jgi:hypothetical protein
MLPHVSKGQGNTRIDGLWIQESSVAYQITLK